MCLTAYMLAMLPHAVGHIKILSIRASTLLANHTEEKGCECIKMCHIQTRTQYRELLQSEWHY